MLRQLVNEARFALTLTTTGPLLIRSGQARLGNSDMVPVQTFRDGDWQVYVPGSSLKGAVRSHAERLLRSIRADAACDPFDGSSVCRSRSESPDAATIYESLCCACRLFGSLTYAGRVAIGDCYLPRGARVRLERRNGVGIDRLTGGSSTGALFDLEAVPSGVSFEGSVRLRNFEAWQLALLLLVFEDLAQGFVPLGGGRSRGYGAVTATIPLLSVTWCGMERPPADAIWGLGQRLRGAYGTKEEDRLPTNTALNWSRQGVRWQATIEGPFEALRGTLEEAVVTAARERKR
ncbi:MAG: hypothetical protein KatS3mg060_2886 [Dehalococcoidia bacterium]|nr:MAG: hypothetical protein KatS3mg060_2886 [Dehalococcoidia bacterium]